MSKTGGETPREVELKLELDPAQVERLRKHPILARLTRSVSPAQDLATVYYDTPDQHLRRAGVSLRVRRIGDEHIQTVKVGSGPAAGLFDRGEWESRITGPDPDLDATAGTPLTEILDGQGVRDALAPLFSVNSRRTILTVGEADWSAELTLDEGEVRAGDRAEPLCELELELREGEPRHLFGLAHELAEAAPLTLGIRTKAERGYTLVDGAAPAVTKAKPVPLRERMSAGQAFQAIARACLTHLLANEPVLRARDEPGAVHQMRVALRRLRAAISLFKPVVDDEARGAVSAELRWLASSFGDARELDVFIGKMLEPRSQDASADEGLGRLAGRAHAEREQAYGRARAAIDSDRYRRLLIDAAGWIETGAWLRGENPDRDRPVRDFADRVLSRYTRRILKEGKHLDELEPEPRHRVRIRVKKLRYACEFFASLAEGKKARRRHADFLTPLEDLQEALGDLNDVATHADLYARLAMGDPPAMEAADRLAAVERERIGDALRPAMDAVRRLKEARRFWE